MYEERATRPGAPAPERNYDFTSDWASSWQRPWLSVLSSFVGAPEVRYLEVGVFEGRSLLWMMEHVFTHASARATAIDPCFMPYGARLEHNLRTSALGEKVELIRGSARQHLRLLPPAGFDVIYVDGSHMADDVLHDLVQAWELLKVGGVLIIDDYGWGTAADTVVFARDTVSDIRPKEAVDAFLRAYRRDIDVLARHWQIVVRKRPPFVERRDVRRHGDAWFCSALGPHLYYWKTRELVLLPAGCHVRLARETADLVEECLRREDAPEKDPRIVRLLAVLDPGW